MQKINTYIFSFLLEQCHLTDKILIDDTVELRKKSDSNSITNLNVGDRGSKPAIPERPAGLVRPSSLIRQQPRQSNENLDTESGVSI